MKGEKMTEIFAGYGTEIIKPIWYKPLTWFKGSCLGEVHRLYLILETGKYRTERKKNDKKIRFN